MIGRNHAEAVEDVTLTPAVLERVGRYMATPGLRLEGVHLAWNAPEGHRFKCWRDLRYFAADVLDKLVADGVAPIMWAMISRVDIETVCRDVSAPTWREAVLLAAAAVQGERDGKHE